jgi:hypothetical protein
MILRFAAIAACGGVTLAAQASLTLDLDNDSGKGNEKPGLGGHPQADLLGDREPVVARGARGLPRGEAARCDDARDGQAGQRRVGGRATRERLLDKGEGVPRDSRASEGGAVRDAGPGRCARRARKGPRAAVLSGAVQRIRETHRRRARGARRPLPLTCAPDRSLTTRRGRDRRPRGDPARESPGRGRWPGRRAGGRKDRGGAAAGDRPEAPTLRR